MIDFGLKDPVEIRKVGEYEVPLDEQLRIQAAEQIVCTDLCMFRDHCDGFCIANQEWKEAIIFETAVLTATPFLLYFRSISPDF